MQQPSVWLKRSSAAMAIELRRNWRSSIGYDLHTHAEYSIGLVDEGQALYQSGQQQCFIKVGDLITIDAALVHACNPSAEPWSYRMVFVEAPYLNTLLQSSQTLSFAHPYQNSPKLHNLFNALFTSVVEDETAFIIESQLIDLCGALWRRHEPTVQMIEPAGLRRVRNLLHEQADQEFHLQELSAVAGLTPYQLVRHFKKTYGLPPHAFQLDRRIQQAKPLLRQGAHLSEVAQTLGFADQAHFQRHFKRRLALTPKTYQQHFMRI
ncbi:AraC family transcriptional regulator [Thiolinea disciformis]|uniref:AraC family transcriptional regulator n=1 Tax=Thiolinea disciformis TaxID=125614 RepID=UPI000365E434|nr:AraC family transcriptional regulator [Thiolinea disciformis]